jgi:uncharacterized protein (DUF2342 family)
LPSPDPLWRARPRAREAIVDPRSRLRKPCRPRRFSSKPAAAYEIETPERLLEALARRRAELPLRDRLIDFWFGVDLAPTAHRRATALLAAVEHALGPDGATRMWNDPLTLPLPEDLEDPRRLLARLG